MKRAKMFLTAFAVVATVGSALAVTNYFGQGSVYCTKTGNVCSVRKDFRINPSGISVNPCGTTGGVENPSYIWDDQNNCTQNNLGLKYDAVSLDK